jgi:uncharacterized Zn-binding protein involved in type VI secretion
MPAVLLDQSIVGGKVTATQSTVFANGKAIVVDQDPIASHGAGVHSSAKMIEKSTKVFIGGKGVSRSGDKASCGHVAASTATVNCG